MSRTWEYEGVERANSIQVLSKVALLLDRLAEEPEVRAGRLADMIGEPRSTVYRLLASLQQLDLVEPGARRGTYRLGLKLFRLGSSVLARFDERQAAFPIMERIHEATEETVFLCIRRGYEAVCIERIDGRWVQSMALRLGGSLPLHVGAAPRALLAFEPRDFWAEYAARGALEAFTHNTPTSRNDLFRVLEEVRTTGCSVSDEDVAVGIAAVGAPVFDYRGEVRAALSMSGPRSTILGESLEASRELITSGALEISRALGFAEDAALVGERERA
jgi:DNA-binding IclR family transcriptional regulator